MARHRVTACVRGGIACMAEVAACMGVLTDRSHYTHQRSYCLWQRDSYVLHMAGVTAGVTACIWHELLPECKPLLPAREKSLGVAYLALWNT